MTETLTYVQKEQRKRTLISYIIAISIYSLLFIAGIVYDILSPESIDFTNSVLIVNIQGPVANDAGQGAPLKKESVVVEKPAPIPPPAPKPQTEATSPKPAPALPPTPSVEATPSPVAPAIQQPIEPWVPGERGPGSRVSSSETSVLAPGEGQVPWGTGKEVRISKSEAGNSVETTLGGSSETVGQSLYVPIYLNMPLPATVPVSLFNAIPDEKIPPTTIVSTADARKRAFLNYYSISGNECRLTNFVPLEVREKLWEMLEDAGYNVAKADYKAGKTLNPVVIGFSVTKDKQLRGVELLQSSGDSDIDQSVLYGFKRASFWNKSGETIQGRFIYRF